MERTYIALVEKDTTSDYGVWFTDLPCCITAGTTFEEAREMAREALMLHLEGMAADGEYIPPPCSADAALAHEDAFDAIALIVVETLPERTEEEAKAEFEAFLASDEYHEIYGHPLAEDDLPYYEEPLVSETFMAGIGLRPIMVGDTEPTYAALVRQKSDGDFGIRFPDLPGCIAGGGALEEACKMARNALARHLESMSANGECIPKPSSADVVLSHPDAAGAIAVIVVRALPERTEEEARAALEELPASDEYREIYGEPVKT